MNKPVWDPNSPRKSALAGQVVAENFAGWTAEIRQEFADNSHNHQVGSVLLSETDDVKVWSIRLAPGERVPAHRHVLNYFWTALTDGISLQHTDDGTTRRVVYRAGETRHFSFPGESTSFTTCTTTAQANWPSSPSSTRTNANTTDE